MTDEQSENQEKQPEKIELRAPTLFSNKFYVVKSEKVTRIIFGDEPAAGSDTMYHSSIVMSNSDAKQLGDLISELMNKK